MSNRTIVEFNHDFAGQVREHSEEFSAAILRLLRSGVRGEPKNRFDEETESILRAFGVTVTPTCHHSEVRTVLLGSHSKILL